MSKENQNNLPPLRTYEEVEKETPDLLSNRKWYGTDIKGVLLDFSKPYTPPKWTLSHNDIPFAKLGDLHIVSGKSGHGKTAFMSQIVATFLCGSFGGMSLCINAETPPIVLYVDTEQSEDDTIAFKNRICTLAGIDYSVRSDVFFIARLRETTSAEDRYRQILQLVWDIRPTVLFIDGLLDIVEDYNDQKECAPIIRELMVVSTFYNISMWCVLHENPTTDKMVGSLGSIAGRKVTEVFVIRKHKKDKLNGNERNTYKSFPKMFFSVEQAKARGKDQDDWYFEITDEQVWGTPREIMTTPGSSSTSINKPSSSFFTPENVKEWISKGQFDIVWPAYKDDIKSIIKKYGKVTNQNKQAECVKIAEDNHYINAQEKSEYDIGQKHPKFKLDEELKDWAKIDALFKWAYSENPCLALSRDDLVKKMQETNCPLKCQNTSIACKLIEDAASMSIINDSNDPFLHKFTYYGLAK